MTAVVSDPTVVLIGRLTLSLLFGTAALHKLRDVASFRAALERYELLPPLWAVPAGAAVIAAEVGIAVGLLLPPAAPVAALAAAALLVLYGAAIAANLARGRRDIDCGCSGPARRQPISGWLVARNALLATLAVGAAVPMGSRSLTWVDGITVVAGVVAAALLYVAADGLLATSASERIHRRGTQRSAEGVFDS
jgi:hypothetical protein